MTDQLRKTRLIRRIEKLQLSACLIAALEDANQAESIAFALEQLIELNHHWH